MPRSGVAVAGHRGHRGAVSVRVRGAHRRGRNGSGGTLLLSGRQRWNMGVVAVAAERWPLGPVSQMRPGDMAKQR